MFHDRKQALNKVLAAEANNKKKISKETFYEEYWYERIYRIYGWIFIGVATSLFAISLCAASDKRENFYDE